MNSVEMMRREREERLEGRTGEYITTSLEELRCRREQNRARQRRWAAAAVSLTACMMFLAWLRIGNTELRYELNEKQAELAELRADETRLRAEIAELSRPERLRRMAEQQGLVRPAPGQVTPVRVQADEPVVADPVDSVDSGSEGAAP